MSERLRGNLTCVALNGRGVVIEGPPGSGKSRLALALIDRGAVLVGDDGVRLEQRGGRLWAHPPPNIAGKIEIRGVGLAELPTASAAICLVLALGEDGERLPDVVPGPWEGCRVPRLSFAAPDPLRAEWALRLHGLPLPPDLV